ncbi:uncharacterized protein M421DRAFT_132562 [Didymella exigua CBS 183.55]|uniref:Fungal N-terminal domain-containing protein n=1 Tax=Didymella exigua CBS 183.55 TaxID=1150837 RepID=A0A6A5R8L5_9PLEO|nr:uncharacterized protein M421DRAFT_132562 [Didymella exigua CBS 183.55]KAF1922177.1 hypothetical protein M421DRAFT_132562 [Didymella exigua CBS 183.55]
MAEVLSVLSATAQLLDQAIRVLGRIRKARQRQKALLDVIAQHESELSSVKAIIGIIIDEESLRTASVCSEVVRLRGVQDKLVKLLEQLDPRLKTSAQQFSHQLKNGSSDESKMYAIMNELGQVKSMLLLRIQVANVGVMRNVQQGLVANTEVIARVDRFLKEEFSGCEGLRIARLLQGRRPSNDGTVPLTPADWSSLRDAADDQNRDNEIIVDDSDSSTGSETKKRASIERIILSNMAKNQAIQINAPLGKDIWKNVDRIVIKNNIAEHDAVQINYNNTLEDTMALMTLRSKLNIAVQQNKSSHIRFDSVMSPA